jgi:hypothetical protein
VRLIEVVGAERLSARLLPNILGHTPREIRFASFHFFGLTTGTARPRGAVPASTSPVGRDRTVWPRMQVHQSTPSPRKARLSASLTGMLSETGVPARLWRAPVPEKRRLSERVYSAISSRIVSIWGFCLPRARGIASPSPTKPCPGNTDGVVASGHRRIDETSVCRGRQPICGRRSAQSLVAPDKLLLRTIACRAARVVQAVGCPGWVISVGFTTGEPLRVYLDQRTSSDWPDWSGSCQSCLADAY